MTGVEKEEPPQHSVGPAILLAMALKQLKSRFDPASIDQRGELLFVLLQRTISNLEKFANGAARADAQGIEVHIFDSLPEKSKDVTPGPSTRPLRQKKASKDTHGQDAGTGRAVTDIEVNRLFTYWKRAFGIVELRKRAPRGPEQKFRARADATDGVVGDSKKLDIEETVVAPFHNTPTVVKFELSVHELKKDDRDKSGIPVIDVTTSVMDHPYRSDPEDRTVWFPASSLKRQLHTAAAALADAFSGYAERTYRWKDKRCSIEVSRTRPSLVGAIAVALVGVLFLGTVGCVRSYRAAVASGERDLYSISPSLYVDTACIGSNPQNRIIWSQPLRGRWWTKFQLLRNGKPIKNITGLREFTDSGVINGGHYNYSLRLADIFGRVLKEDHVVVGGSTQCPGGANVRPWPWRTSPKSGNWDTVFTFSINPPRIDGIPAFYSWSWEGSRARGDRTLYENFTPPSRSSTITHRFSPCDRCAGTQTPGQGVWRWSCGMTVEVIFTDGSRRRYLEFVEVVDETRRECSGAPANATK